MGKNTYDCMFDKKYSKILYNNPHCIEYHCKKIDIVKHTKKCESCYVYNIDDENTYTNDMFKTNNIDKYKNLDNFYKEKFIYKLKDIDVSLNYEYTKLKPKTVCHWGQLKLFLTTLFFLVKVIKPNKNYNILYPGSAPGDALLLLIDMFPNISWYLIDPRDCNKKLHEHKQVKEIIKDYFTDEMVNKYADQFKNDKSILLLISDIRSDTSDKGIIFDQNLHIKWHKKLKPKYSYFKFRCPYEIPNDIYSYYEGKIYLQPFAPTSSTETRLLLKKKLKKYDYDINKYQGSLLYFNRVIRPSYYVKSIIKDNDYFDHCYDCTYFSYLIKNYLKHVNKYAPFIENNDIYYIMKYITNYIINIPHKDTLLFHNTNLRKHLNIL
jgi:hypothetical protein